MQIFSSSLDEIESKFIKLPANGKRIKAYVNMGAVRKSFKDKVGIETNCEIEFFNAQGETILRQILI